MPNSSQGKSFHGISLLWVDLASQTNYITGVAFWFCSSVLQSSQDQLALLRLDLEEQDEAHWCPKQQEDRVTSQLLSLPCPSFVQRPQAPELTPVMKTAGVGGGLQVLCTWL